MFGYELKKQDQVVMKSHRSKTSRYCFSQQQVVRQLYPGRSRPGLIEARRPARRGPADTAPIRGVRAPASLKLPVAIPRHELIPAIRGVRAPASLKRGIVDLRGTQISELYPGRSRPGLIEADRGQYAPAPDLRTIRGVRAPASLKPATI